MWTSKEAMTPLHKTLYKVTNRIQQGGTPLYSVVFNFIDPRFYDYFASAGGNRINLGICLRDGGTISPFHSYTDEDIGESFYTVSWARGVEGNPFVAAGGLRGIIRVINVNDKVVHKTLVGHHDPVNEIMTHPTKPQLVLSASKDGTVRLWNIETGICVLIFAGASEVLSVDFHPHDKHRFVSCAMDATTNIWSMKELWTYVEKSFTWNDDPSQFPTQVFTASDRSNELVNCNRWFGDRILSKNNMAEIVLWQPKFRENSPGEGVFNSLLAYHVPDSHRSILKFSCDPSMKWVSLGNQKGKIYVWDLQTYPPVLVTVLSHYKSKTVIRQTAMSFFGKTILATSEDGTLWRWDMLMV